MKLAVILLLSCLAVAQRVPQQFHVTPDFSVCKTGEPQILGVNAAPIPGKPTLLWVCNFQLSNSMTIELWDSTGNHYTAPVLSWQPPYQLVIQWPLDWQQPLLMAKVSRRPLGEHSARRKSGSLKAAGK